MELLGVAGSRGCCFGARGVGAVCTDLVEGDGARRCVCVSCVALVEARSVLVACGGGGMGETDKAVTEAEWA